MKKKRNNIFSLLIGSFREAWRIATSAIRANKLRSVLTVLGIVIGVMTIITLVSLIEGLSNSITEQIGSLGSNYLYISKSPTMQFGQPNPEHRFRKDLTIEDAIAIEEHCPDVLVASPILFDTARLSYGGNSTGMQQIVAGDEDLSEINSFFIAHGRDLTAGDVEARRRVTVIGADIVDALFGNSDPLGKEIRIGRHKFKVIGVLERRGEFFGQSQDNVVAIPYTTFLSTFQSISYQGSSIWINAISTSPATVFKAANQIETLLRRRRGVKPADENDFEIATQGGLLEIFDNITTVIYAIMIGVASVSLLVGGIGIMNIMLVAVSERTREIGIRKALGAKRKDIMSQFIIEALLLTFFGGLIGVALGWGLAALLAGAMDLPNAITWWSVALGLGFSIIVGLFFGTFPAARAASLDPIEALRHE